MCKLIKAQINRQITVHSLYQHMLQYLIYRDVRIMSTKKIIPDVSFHADTTD